MTKTHIKVSEARFPKLTRAVLRSVDREQLIDVCNHGANAGFGQFTYYKHTLAFYKRHKKDILAHAKEGAEEMEMDLLEMVKSFGCLKDVKFSGYEIAQGLDGKGEMATQIQNAMAWYTLEEIARELNPDL